MKLAINLKILAQPKFLLTGFTTFQSIQFNPTQVLMEELQAISFQEINLKTMILSVSFQKSRSQLQKLILQFKPDVILSFGLTWVDRIHLERRAINLSQGEDSDGKIKKNEPVIKGGPLYHDATIALRPIQRELAFAGIPSKINSKPTEYVCNHLFYSTLDFIQQKKLNIKSGFIHVPNVFRTDPKIGKIYAVDKPEYKEHAISMQKLKVAAEIIIETVFNTYLKTREND